MSLKVVIREYEKNWGSSIIDVQDFEDIKQAEEFADSINSQNTHPTTPDYYIQAEVVVCRN
jgi:hypothetical protein